MSQKETPSRTKRYIELFRSIVISMLIAAGIRWATFENFTIPTASMERTLRVGDVIAVSKLHYGIRIPITLFQIPLTHKYIWGTQIPSYIKNIQLPYYRLPGFSSAKRFDKIVFNDPRELEFPIDQRTYFIKRCVALPGDTIQIKNRALIVNGENIPDPPECQYRYKIDTGSRISRKYFEDHHVTLVGETNSGYIVDSTASNIEFFEKLPLVDNIEISHVGEDEEMNIILGYPHGGWNLHHLGPLVVPKKGTTIALDSLNICVYKVIIMHHEGNTDVKVIDDKIILDGQEVSTYTFKKNYYFVRGDNTDNSNDSRFWGFVPEDHIVGKAVMVLFSKEPSGSLIPKFRWKRFFRIKD